MEQIAVTKITTDGRGNKTSRNMTIPKNTWLDIVKNGSGEANVEWKLRSEQPVVAKEIEVIAPEPTTTTIQGPEITDPEQPVEGKKKGNKKRF